MRNGGNKPRVRSFDWRDLRMLQRLQGQGRTLDYETARVDGVFPLRDALRAYLLLGTSGRRTLVMAGMDAFAQYTWRKDSDQAQLTYLAPAPTDDTSVERWIDLLEHLVATAGNSGVHHIVAEASDDGPEIEVLQRAGFGVFTRQTLFCLTSAPLRADAQPELAGLRPWQHTDDWGLRLLYANTVPQLVQQIEAPADSAFASAVWQHRLVLERNGEIIASVATRRGRIGSALRLLMHPQAEVHVEALLRCGLERLADGPSQPIYCRVRRYEGCLQAPLEACGFELMASTALLVKHTVARVMTPEWHRTAVAEGRAEVTTPVVRARFTRPRESPTNWS